MITLRTLSLMILFVVFATSVHAARVEMSGFEMGATTECVSTGTIQSVQTTTVYSGTYALEVNPTGTNTGHCVLSTISATGANAAGNSTGTFYSVFRFRAATLPASGNEPIFSADDVSTNQKFTLRITSTGKLAAYDSTSTQLGSNGASTIATGTWYLIGVKVGHGASGAYEVQLEGATELSGTGNLGTGNHAQRAFGKRVNISGQSVDFFYDDVVIDDASFPSGGKIVALHPDANGSTMQWTAGTNTSDYTQVNEVVPVTTTYVQSVAQNDVALFAFESLPGTLDVPIGAVKLMVRIAEVTSTSTSFSVRIRSSSTNSDSTAGDAGNASFATRSRLLATDPATATAWTVAGVNAVEAGGVNLTVTLNLRIAWVALMVEAAPAGAAPATRTRISVY